MSSGPRKDQDEPVHEEPHPNAADASSPPSPASPTFDRVREQPRDPRSPGTAWSSTAHPGDPTSPGTAWSSTAAAAADTKDKKNLATPSPASSSAGSVFYTPSSADSSSGSRGKEVRWRRPVVAVTMTVPSSWARRRSDCEPVVDQLARELAEIQDAERRWAAAAEKEKRQNQESKKTPWSKFTDYCKNKFLGIKRKLQTSRPHVDYETTSMCKAIRHYTMEHGVPVYLMKLPRGYSEFRLVFGDGECFYRSFIFSYLEQVLDRQDIHEERRLLDAVEKVATQHAGLGWTSEFSSSHEAFEKLINKVMKWKRRWNIVASTNSYRKQKLLRFFSTYDKTEHIFAFLRLVAAIWICSHSDDYEEHIPELKEGCSSLKDWCFQHVTPSRAFADHVSMTALATALEVPLRVEPLAKGGRAQDIYTGQGVPRVTLVYTGNHYDIIYPVHPSDQS